MPTKERASAESSMELVRRTARELIPDLEPLIAGCCAAISADMPELRDEELARGLHESVDGNLREIFTMLRDGVPVESTIAPRGALNYAGIMVRRNVPLAQLLRAYRIGMQYLCRVWTSELQLRAGEQALLAESVECWNEFMFAYVDDVSDAVTEQYASERERWHRSAAALRMETVQALLADDKSLDPDAASSRLGYELRRCHVAFLLWSEAGEDHATDVMPALEKAANGIARDLGGARPLLVPHGRTELWMWVAFEAPPSEDDLTPLAGRHLAGRGLAAACGLPGSDADGFRRSYNEALHAQSVARHSGGRGRLATYGRVVVSSLLLSDRDRAETFVRRELGPLAKDDDATSRVRATLRVYFEEGSRCATTARRLGIHQNTVLYRLHRAEALLGHELGERRFEVEAALRLLPLVS